MEQLSSLSGAYKNEGLTDKFTKPVGIGWSYFQARRTQLRGAWNILSQVQLSYDFLNLSILCRSHKNIA